MKRWTFLLIILCFVVASSFAGFKSKNLRPKKPEQYQTRVSASGVTFAADLLLEGKEQKDFFYKELTSSNVIAVRLAVFNNGKHEVILPVEEIQLLGPSGKPLPLIAPEAVAQAVLQGLDVTAEARKKESPVQVGPNVRSVDPRVDRTDPRYDPRLDPDDPTYDPMDPRNRRYGDPRYNDPRYGGYGYPRPGVDVIVNPRVGSGGGGDMSQFERQLIEKDFSDKAHSADPIDGMMVRDRFLYFSMNDRPLTDKGFVLRLPKSKGIAEEVVLKF
jgi:hypothetical protein